jgi:hypothetical protein
VQITSNTTVRKELKLNSADLQNQIRESELGCGRSVARDAEGRDRDGSYHGAHLPPPILLGSCYQGTQRSGRTDVAGTASSRGLTAREQLAPTVVSPAPAAAAASGGCDVEWAPQPRPRFWMGGSLSNL